MATGCFQQIDSAFDIDPLLESRLFQARPHAGSRGQVNNLVESHAAEQLLERIRIVQIPVNELKRLAKYLDLTEVMALYFRVVKIVQIVERRYPPPEDAIYVLHRSFDR